MSTLSRSLPFGKEQRGTKPAPVKQTRSANRLIAEPPSEKDLREYIKLSERRRAMEREARQIKDAEDILFEKIFAYTKVATKATRRPFTNLFGYVLSLVEGGKYPAWKQAFITKCGEAAAQKVIDQTKPSVGLSIEKARRGE